MSILVKQAVLHQLEKQENPQTSLETPLIISPHLRQALLLITPAVEQMMLQLHQCYQGKAKAYGVFQEQSVFAQKLNQWLEKEQDFLSFSQQSAKLLAQELSQYSFSSDGTFIFCQYNFLATDYLFIALLDSRASMLVDDSLNIQPTQYLDMTKFDIACRINLTELQQDAQSCRYLTFIKGRVGRKISDFFMDFLGAEEGLNPKAQNQCLLQAVNDFCQQDEKANEQEIKKQVFHYCAGQLKAGEEIEISELSAQMPTLNEKSFANFTQEANYDLAPSIPPVRNSLKSLTKFSGSGKGISLSFNAELLHNRVIWDEENDCITIQGLPPNLRDQLQRAK